MPTIVASKLCLECKRIKPLSHFFRNRRSIDGHFHYCIECHRRNLADRAVKGSPEGYSSTRRCRRCKIIKPVTEFNKDKSRANGVGSYCRSCSNHHLLGHHLRKTFNLTHTQYLDMLKRQNYVCAICCEPETVIQFGKVPRLSVDHDHKTGKVRGLLCYKCNHFVGFIQRFGIKGLDRAVEYLTKHGSI